MESPNIWRNNVSGRGNSKCKGLEAGMCQDGSKNTKGTNMANVMRQKGIVGGEGEEIVIQSR